MSDSARPWVESARRSFDAAELLHAAGRWPQTCFRAQQCAELMFKAVIVHSDVAPPRVHGIVELLNCLSPSLRDQLSHLAPGLQDLDRYYAPTRYPDAVVGNLPGEQEATEALAVAQEVASLVAGILESGG